MPRKKLEHYFMYDNYCILCKIPLPSVSRSSHTKGVTNKHFHSQEHFSKYIELYGDEEAPLYIPCVPTIPWCKNVK